MVGPCRIRRGLGLAAEPDGVGPYRAAFHVPFLTAGSSSTSLRPGRPASARHELRQAAGGGRKAAPGRWNVGASRASGRGRRPPSATPGPGGLRLLTVGHGTASRDEFTRLVRGAGVQLVVDVRSAPGSRRSPQFGRAELQAWLPGAGVGYRWEPRRGGFRRPAPDSPNVALRHASFRGYADYMASDMFGDGLAGLAAEAARQVTAVMCAETPWWRCHRS